MKKRILLSLSICLLILVACGVEMSASQRATWDLIEEKVDAGFDSWGDLVLWSEDQDITVVFLEGAERVDSELMEQMIRYGVVGDFIEATALFDESHSPEVYLGLHFESLGYNEMISELIGIDRASVDELKDWLEGGSYDRLHVYFSTVELMSADEEHLADATVEIEFISWDVEFESRLSFEHNFIVITVNYILIEIEEEVEIEESEESEETEELEEVEEVDEVEESVEVPIITEQEHPFAIALREFEAGTSSGAVAFLVDIDGNGTQGMVAVNRWLGPDDEFPWGTLFFLYNGELRTADLGCQWGSPFITVRTVDGDRLVNLFADGVSLELILFALEAGQLIPTDVVSSHPIWRPIVDEEGEIVEFESYVIFMLNEEEINEEEFYAFLYQHGLDYHDQNRLNQAISMIRDGLDESPFILSMTIPVE